MIGRSRLIRLSGVLALAAALAVVAAGCGGGGDKSSSEGDNGSSGKTYAQLNVVWDAPDYFDPAPELHRHRLAGHPTTSGPGLLGYKHVNGPAGATIIPYLARAADGLVRRQDLHVHAARGSSTRTARRSRRATSRRRSSATSRSTRRASASSPTSRVQRPNGSRRRRRATSRGSSRTTRRARSDQADAAAGRLPVHPRHRVRALRAADTPAKDQSTHRRPATGPYMIQSYTPNRSVVVVRNPNYNGQIAEMPDGNPDKMTCNDHRRRHGRAAARVISGQVRLRLPPDPDRPARARRRTKYADQIKLYTPANTYYFSMNTRLRRSTI